jgi:hypothetical protein
MINDRDAFFAQFVSLLRVDTKVDDLCKAKSSANLSAQTGVKQTSRNFLLAHTKEEQQRIGISNCSNV